MMELPVNRAATQTARGNLRGARAAQGEKALSFSKNTIFLLIEKGPF